MTDAVAKLSTVLKDFPAGTALPSAYVVTCVETTSGVVVKGSTPYVAAAGDLSVKVALDPGTYTCSVEAVGADGLPIGAAVADPTPLVIAEAALVSIAIPSALTMALA